MNKFLRKGYKKVTDIFPVFALALSHGKALPRYYANALTLYCAKALQYFNVLTL